MPNDLNWFVNQLIRTDHHFILGTTAKTHALVDGNNDFRPVGLILLMDRDFNALDHLIINARADYWTDGMTIVNNTLYVLFWTPSLNPIFLDPITGDQYYSLILEVALQPALLLNSKDAANQQFSRQRPCVPT
jgi:hypothetical protein